MENQNQIQKINRQMLVEAGCKMHSIELIRNLMLGKRVEVNAVKTDLVPAGNPNFELLFSKDKSTQFSIVQKALGEGNMKKTIVVILED